MNSAAPAAEAACTVCSTPAKKTLHTATELMYGMGGEFVYEECAQCGCLRLLNPPADMASYYPEDYYSFAPQKQTPNKPAVEFLKRQRSKHLLGQSAPLGALLAKISSEEPYYNQRLKRAGVQLNSRILDVGCGSGTMLCNMRKDGFPNLTGVDPFIAEDIEYPTGVTIYKRSLAQMDSEFDVILSHHSFEHMPDPEDTFDQFNRLLAAQGQLLLSIPLADSYAWKKYGVNWVNLDAPRHLYLHSARSIEALARRNGFKLKDTVFDSSAQQFWGSEQYCKGIGYRAENSYSSNPEASTFSPEQIAEFERQAHELNHRGEGDMATFYFVKAGAA